jgi:hypothetical protein
VSVSHNLACCTVGKLSENDAQSYSLLSTLNSATCGPSESQWYHLSDLTVLQVLFDCASFSDSLPTVQHAKLCETDTVQNLTDIKMCSTAHTELRCNEPNFSKVKSLFKLPDSLEETERDKQNYRT